MNKIQLKAISLASSMLFNLPGFISKKDDKYIMEYCSDERIFNRKYLLI